MFVPLRGKRHQWLEALLIFWKLGGVLIAILLAIAAFVCVIGGFLMLGDRLTEATGRVLILEGFGCAIGSITELVTTLGLLELCRIVINIESLLLREKRLS